MEGELTAQGPDMSVRIDVVHHDHVNLAMQQNAVPLVESVRLTNQGAEDLRELVVRFRTEPQIARTLEMRLECLGAGETHETGPVDLQLDAQLLVRQLERERGTLHIHVAADEATIGETERRLDVLAYDEWSGSSALEELLAAYVLPNHPDVEQILTSARDVLGEQTGNPSLDGYQSQSPRRVQEIVRAIYEAIRRLELTYINPPASFEKNGQKVRTPDRILASRMGTCLDLTLLVAGCLEQAGLHPIVLLKDGHAWAGVGLEDDTFATPTVTEPLFMASRSDGKSLYSESALTLTTGTSKVTWDWASAVDLSGLIAVVIDVLSVDLPGASLEFTLCSGAACSSDSFALPNVVGTYGWQITNFIGTADLTMIDSAMLMIDGSLVEDLDVAIDFVQVPEASVLGLFGLSLIGLGLAARRRELR